MRDASQHVPCVDAWLERASKQPAADLWPLFEHAFGALWRRTLTTLGEVTLTAIADRVFHNAAEAHPGLAGLKIDSRRGLQVDPHAQLALPPAELRAAIRFVLLEFLTVLGTLTAEILTPELHAELAKASSVPAGKPGSQAPVAPTNPHTAKDEDQS